MRFTVERKDGYINATIVARDTAEEQRAFANAQVRALRESGLRRLLVSVKSSQPVFKVQRWDLSAILDDLVAMGVKVALVSDSRELAMSHEYVALLGKQRGLSFATFRDEQLALGWLMAPE